MRLDKQFKKCFLICTSLSHSLSRLYHSQRTLPLLPETLTTPTEPLVFLRTAQEEWEGRIRKILNTLATHLGEPLAKEVYYAEHSVRRVPYSSCHIMYIRIVRSRKILDAEIKLVTDYLSIVHIHSCRLCPVNVVGEVEMLMLKVQSFCSYRVCLISCQTYPTCSEHRLS